MLQGFRQELPLGWIQGTVEEASCWGGAVGGQWGHRPHCLARISISLQGVSCDEVFDEPRESGSCQVQKYGLIVRVPSGAGLVYVTEMDKYLEAVPCVSLSLPLLPVIVCCAEFVDASDSKDPHTAFVAVSSCLCSACTSCAGGQ